MIFSGASTPCAYVLPALFYDVGSDTLAINRPTAVVIKSTWAIRRQHHRRYGDSVDAGNGIHLLIFHPQHEPDSYDGIQGTSTPAAHPQTPSCPPRQPAICRQTIIRPELSQPPYLAYAPGFTVLPPSCSSPNYFWGYLTVILPPQFQHFIHAGGVRQTFDHGFIIQRAGQAGDARCAHYYMRAAIPRPDGQYRLLLHRSVRLPDTGKNN